MLTHLIEIDFLRYTVYTGLLIGIIAPLLGAFLVVRRLSLLADALSHVTLAGIAFGLLLEKIFILPAMTPFISGMSYSVVGAMLIEKLRSIYKSYEEIGIPIILSTGIGLTVIFISLANGFNTDLFNYLFGSISAISRADFLLVFIISIIVITLIILFYKELVTLSFDEEHAIVSGIRAKSIHLLFIILTALVIAASIRIVGVLLVSALMTLPVAAAMRFAKSFKQLILFAIIFAEISVILGLVFGYYLRIPPGGTIVMVAVVILLIAIGYKRIVRKHQKGAHENE